MLWLYNGHPVWFILSLNMFPFLGNTLRTLSFICRWNYGNNFTLSCLSLYLLEVLKWNHCLIELLQAYPQQLGSQGMIAGTSRSPRLWLRQEWGSKLIHTTLNKGLRIPLYVRQKVCFVDTFDRCCSCCLVAKSCPTLCDPMDCSTPGFPVLHYLPEFAEIHVHWVNDTI